MKKGRRARRSARWKRKLITPNRREAFGMGDYLNHDFVIDDDIETPDGIDPREVGKAALAAVEGRFDEAKVAFEDFIRRVPEFRDAYTNLAAAHWSSGDVKTCEALLKEAVDKFPDYVLPRANLAQIYLKRGAIKQAQEVLPTLDRVRHFTYSDFDAYAIAWVDICNAKGDEESAVVWSKVYQAFLAEVPPDVMDRLSMFSIDMPD